MRKILVIFLIIAASISGQEITWTDITSNYLLPHGIKVFSGTRTSPKLAIWYIDVDLNNEELVVRPYISESPKSVPSFCSSVGAYMAVNGGYFGGSASYSAVVYPSVVKAQNVASLVRNSQSYPVMRSFFHLKEDRNCSVDWIYHFGGEPEDIYSYSEPLPYLYNDPTPKPAPSQSDGISIDDILCGIGGGPTLVKNGEINITYNEEIFWGSGVGYDNSDPRTAVGYTDDNHVIMLTADGRQTISEGVGLPELAQIMIDLGCTEAMNLDGGGSTQMAIDNTYLNNPSETRAVPTILAVTHVDSLPVAQEPTFEKIIDTGDPEAEIIGTGWFESANAGYWGDTKALLHALDPPVSFVKFTPDLPAEAEYEVWAWWVASSNRCRNTPFVIEHAAGSDVVFADQTANGSSWQYLGTWTFNPSGAEISVSSEGFGGGTYVVADAVKIISYDDLQTGSKSDKNLYYPQEWILDNNFPNPFNPETKITFYVPERNYLKLSLLDVLGREIKALAEGYYERGSYSVTVDGADLSSGIYFYHLQSDSYSEVKKMTLLK